MNMAILPTTTFQHPDDDWFKTVNGGKIHSIIPNPTPIPSISPSNISGQQSITSGFISNGNTGNTIYTHGAIGNVSLNYDTVKKFNLKEFEYAIRGEMYTVQKVMSDLDYFQMESKLQMQLPDFIKQELVYKLAEYLMQSKSILFTAQTNNTTLEKTFRASIFATPDSQVRILKEFQKRNT